MAATSVQANNKALTFRRKGEREMPMLPKSNNTVMRTSAERDDRIGIPPISGKKKLPRRARRAAKMMRRRGLISDKAHAKMEFAE